MPNFATATMWRLADLTEMTLKVNKQNVVEGKKSVKFAVGGHAFDITFNVIGSCYCEDAKVSALLLETSRGDLGLVLGAHQDAPHQSFLLIVDMTKVLDKHWFDSHPSLPQMMNSVSPGMVKCFMQDQKETPWYERDMTEFAVA